LVKLLGVILFIIFTNISVTQHSLDLAQIAFGWAVTTAQSGFGFACIWLGCDKIVCLLGGKK